MPAKSTPVTNVPGKRSLLKYVEDEKGKQEWYPDARRIIWWFIKNGWHFIHLGDRNQEELEKAVQQAKDNVPRRSFMKVGWGEQENVEYRGILFKNPKDAVIFRLQY